MTFSEDLESLKSAGPTPQALQKINGKYPKGWEPKIEYDPTSGGEFVTSPREATELSPDEENLFAEFELDPNKWNITGLRRSRWQTYNGDWLEAFRCTFLPRNISVSDEDLDRIIDDIRKAKPSKREFTGELAHLTLSGDQQIGKPDGDGTAGTVQRIVDKTNASLEILKESRRHKLPIGPVYLPQLGDCIEGFNSQGGRLQWRNELTLTQMVRVYRRVLMYQVKTFAPYAEKLIVPIIPGNHDEAVRVGDVMGTTYTDSWAIEAASAVQDALAENPEAYGHVHFVFPEDDELTITLDIMGTVVGFAHGHQFGRDPLKWWAGQAHGRQPIGDATILFGAHLHHLHIEQTGGDKTFIRVPALDGGSTWFRHKTGENASAGMMNLNISESGWNNLVMV